MDQLATDKSTVSIPKFTSKNSTTLTYYFVDIRSSAILNFYDFLVCATTRYLRFSYFRRRVQ